MEEGVAFHMQGGKGIFGVCDIPHGLHRLRRFAIGHSSNLEIACKIAKYMRQGIQKKLDRITVKENRTGNNEEENLRLPCTCFANVR
jgi:hypothetical protein